MLRLHKICKDYKVADTVVHALKGVSLSFRKNEFVSVLGPSGCGKTTLLNIIGGLDKYSAGDLFINGRSTKEFKDSDWDVYRNHRVGFIFQSYNLIPHQTILGNVELALTIAGVSKNERIKKAKKALDKVGLEGQYNKKPNQLSGGQCQRVAIARAIVNDPEILLADEPTGALDTTTSIQIMEIIKEIANDRLVIMVTHNAKLAEQYSTRIINLLDGEVVGDSNSFSKEEEIKEVEQLAKEKQEQENQEEEKRAKLDAGKKKKNEKKKKPKEKAKMSFWAAFKLSAQNLFSKRGRTIMTSIAGAIGIIGVSLVLSISFGVRTYISDLQNDMLSGNPITISQTATDLNALLSATPIGEQQTVLKENGIVNVDSVIESLVQRSGDSSSFTINNTITQEYIDFIQAMPEEYVASIFLDYGLDVTNNIYTSFYEEKGGTEQNLSLSTIKSIYTSVLKETDYANYAGYITSLSRSFMQAPGDEDYVLSQYNVLSGKIASEANEVMIVVSQDRELTDLLLTQLGYYAQDEFLNIIYRATDDENNYQTDLDKTTFTYEELLGKSFVYYPNDTVFTATGDMYKPFSYSPSSEGFTGGLELKVVGILEPKDTISYGCLSSGFYYTDALTNYIIENNMHSQIATYLNALDGKSITSMNYNGMDSGITYTYSYVYNGERHQATGYVGSANIMSSLLGTIGFNMQEYYTLTAQNVGGVDLAYQIKVYPVDFEQKEFVLDYLDKWNSEEDIVVNGVTIPATERDDITYTDNISLIISMVNNLIDIVTYALIGFTALSLVVSCVMIAIITYVSVVERTKEIGVVRSLGGRKRDVAYLFNAETFIIGLGSGLIGIAVTYLLSWVANLIISSLTIVTTIAIFPWYYAVIMVCVSVILTLISGLFPSMSAARRDPVVALRAE